MCGRYQIEANDDIIDMREIFNEINERYKDSLNPAKVKTGEISPTDTAPVLIGCAERPQAVLMKWGFPKWQGTGVIINARAETAEDKIMFRPSLTSRRCVVPATGFFEWRQENDRKTKYLFFLPGAKMLYLAGLYGEFNHAGTPYDAYLILTTPANSSVAPYHDRMPLVLAKDETDAWLRSASFAFEHVHLPCRAMLEASAV